MFPVAVAIGFFAGYALDGWLGSRPWFSILGLALGFAAATRNLLKTVTIDDDRSRRSE
jgi:F0F1-type ATP synthase assembly protein I